jgi:imidazolonepropionase-like amidohydrolase
MKSSIMNQLTEKFFPTESCQLMHQFSPIGQHTSQLLMHAVWGFSLWLVGVLTIIIPSYSPAAPLQSLHENHSTPSHAFVNGKWFNGSEFEETTFYSVNGILTKTKPDILEEVTDLRGKFVVPPFGEAHTHNVEGPWDIDHVIANYIRDGIFYVKNPNNIRDFADQIRDKINQPHSIDVAFAHAGLTGPDGHPIALYEDILRLHRYPSVIGLKKRGWFNNRGYFTIGSPQDLQDKWPQILSGKPNFIKIYLADSGHFDRNHESTPGNIRRGLNPKLIGFIVTLAHRQGLRVSAHVETAFDFRLAVTEGVDEIAHVPGWFLQEEALAPHMLLTREDAHLAAQRNVVVVTTTVAGHFHPKEIHPNLDGAPTHHKPTHGHHTVDAHTALRDAAKTVQISNLQQLHQAGVRLAIGSDHAETSLAEALNLHEFGIFDNLTVLKFWCENTPQAIFPNRKIGKLADGFEASFLVLTGNPIDDFQSVKTIALRFKQGMALSSQK